MEPKYPGCKQCPAYRHYKQALKATARWEHAHRAERNKYMRDYRQGKKNKLSNVCKGNTNQ